jgi:Lrp/AsnC family leucine-responsive transcriptional regulator
VARRRPLRLDGFDRKLLDLLQQDATRPLHEFGELVGLSPSAVQRRISRYRSSGLAARQVLVVDPNAVADTIIACVFVTLEQESKRLHGEFQERLRRTPEVQQCYDLAGDRDYLVILTAPGMARCRELVDSLFLGASNVKRYDTHFVLSVVKQSLEIPMLQRGTE